MDMVTFPKEIQFHQITKTKKIKTIELKVEVVL